MKFGNEIRVGILALIAAAILFFGYNYLMGKTLFKSTTTYKVEYDSLNGLLKSARVLINGYKVGTVSDIYLKEDYSGKIVVEMELKSDIKVPRDAKAVILSTSLMGSIEIGLEYDKPCSGADCAQEGDYLKGDYKGMVSGMLEDVDFDDLSNQLGSALTNVVDSLMAKVNGATGAENGEGFDLKQATNDLQATLANLNTVSSDIKRLTNSNGELNGILADVKGITGNLNANKDEINAIIANSKQLTEKLNNLQVEGSIEEVNKTIAELRTSLKKFDDVLENVNGITSKISEGDGTIAKLLNDDLTLDKVHTIMDDADLLLKDVRLNPKRYVNVSIFGKKQKEYTPVE